MQFNINISFQGRYFSFGCSRNDYHIRLGQSNCSIDSFSDNRITCVPPKTFPQNHPALGFCNSDNLAALIVRFSLHCFVSFTSYPLVRRQK